LKRAPRCAEPRYPEGSNVRRLDWVVVSATVDGDVEVVEMTKQDLVEAVAKATGLSKRGAAGAVEATIEGIAKGIRKDKRLALSGFGTFTVRKRKARLGRNPRTGEEITIGASKTVGFKAAPALRTGI
jgi:DNA-binding protein HU-beta